MNELLSYHDRMDYENQILSSDDYSSQKIVIIGKGSRGEFLSPYLVEDEKEAVLLFGNSELSKSFSEAKGAGARLIYLLRIDYNSYKEKARQLQLAYEVLEFTPVDIILLANTGIEEKHYNYPVLRDYINISFDLNAVKGSSVLSTVSFPQNFKEPITLNTSSEITKLTDKKVKEYFIDENRSNLKKYSYQNSSDFETLVDKGLSTEYLIESNQIKPLKYETYIDSSGRVNDPEGYFPQAEFITKEFGLGNDFNIKRIKVNIEGDFDSWRPNKSVEIYYKKDDEFIQIKNNTELIVRDEKINTTNFKFKLNNANYIDPPLISKINIELTYSGAGDYNYFHIHNQHPYVKIWTKSDGSDYVYASFDKEEFVNTNTFSEYLVSDLVRACRRLNTIGIVRGPVKDYNESFFDYKNRAKKIIKDVKLSLDNDELRKYVSCLLSFGFIKNDNGIYSNSLEAAYAGLFGSIYSDQTATNKNIDNIESLEKMFDEKDLKELSDHGYTLIYKTIRNGIVPYKALSLVENKESSFLSINSTRIGNEVIKRVNKITDEYIGGGFYGSTNEITKKLKKELNLLIKENKINEFKINIDVISKSEVFIHIEVKIDNEIFKINITDKS